MTARADGEYVGIAVSVATPVPATADPLPACVAASALTQAHPRHFWGSNPLRSVPPATACMFNPCMGMRATFGDKRRLCALLGAIDPSLCQVLNSKESIDALR